MGHNYIKMGCQWIVYDFINENKKALEYSAFLFSLSVCLFIQCLVPSCLWQL